MASIARSASAHQSQVVQVNNKLYLFTVGFLNEPAYVDDKSGVDVRVKLADPRDPSNSASRRALPMSGLEKTLKVEISAGDKKQVLDLQPAYKDPGAYHAIFFPTIATTYSFKLFGTINGAEVAIPFQCGTVPAEAASAKDVTLANGIIKKSQLGEFGCPLEKAALSFPESVASAYEAQHTSEAENTMHSIFITLSIVSFVFSVIAFTKVRKMNKDL